MYKEKIAELKAQIAKNKNVNIDELTIPESMKTEPYINIGTACYEQGVELSDNVTSKYGIEYTEIMGVAIDKNGRDLAWTGHEFKFEDVAGYRLATRGVGYDDFGHKFRTAEPVKQGGKPVILSPKEFGDFIQEAARKVQEIDQSYVKKVEKEREVMKDVVQSHVGQHGKMGKVEKVYKLAKAKLKSSSLGE